MLRSPLTHNLGHLDQGKVELAFVFGSSVEDSTNAKFY